MRAWTVHLPPQPVRASVPSAGAPGAPPTKQRRAPRQPPPPVLLREGFAFWGLVLGPVWLLWQGCWLAALGAALLFGLAATLPGVWGVLAPLGVALLIGLHGQDIRRLTLARRGWRLAHVVLGPDEDSALARLLTAEPKLVAAFAERRAPAERTAPAERAA